MELKKKVKINKNQETDGYGRDKRPETEKTKTEGNNDNWKQEKKTETEKKAVKQSGCRWNQSKEVPDVYGDV